MFIDVRKPKDIDCGLNLDLMVEALPRIADEADRIVYANRIVGLIKQSHINWVDAEGNSPEAWDHFFSLAPFDPETLGIKHPYRHGLPDLAR